MAVLGTKFGADPLAIRRRSLAYVDRDVPNATANATHELVLPARGRLEMQPAQCESRNRQRVIVLHKTARHTVFLKRRFGIYLGEPATRIAEALGANDFDGRQGHDPATSER